MPEANVLQTHHILQQDLKRTQLIKALGGIEYLLQEINEIHLPSSANVASATGAPLHLSNHPWILDAQRGVLDAHWDEWCCQTNVAVAEQCC